MARILLLTPRLPYPPDQGASIRNYYILRNASANHEVDLMCFSARKEGESSSAADHLLEFAQWISIEPLPIRSKSRRAISLAADPVPDMVRRFTSTQFKMKLLDRLSAVDEPYDIAQFEGLEMSQYMRNVRNISPATRLLYDAHNAEAELQRRFYEKDRRTIRTLHSAIYSLIQTHKIEAFESEVCGQADSVTAVSSKDRSYLCEYIPDRKIRVIPNFIDSTVYEPEIVSEGYRYDLVFTGKMDYRPNVDAVLWFASSIWPMIRAKRPETTWAIVGRDPVRSVAALGEQPGITVTGFVQHVQPYVFGASICIMPFRIGSGTRLKLLEALTSSKAVVSTTVGCEGYGAVHERHLLIANTEAEFAASVLELLDNETLRLRLGEVGARFGRQFDWRIVTPEFDLIYKNLLEGDKLSARK